MFFFIAGTWPQETATEVLPTATEWVIEQSLTLCEKYLKQFGN